MSQTPAPEHGSGPEAAPALDPETIASPPVGAGDEPAADHAAPDELAADQPNADPRAAAEPAHADPPPGPAVHPATADPRVDDALSRLAEVEALPLAEQVAVYADIHRRLAGVLSDPDSQA